MVSSNQAINEAMYLKDKLNSLKNVWDGKECILEMKNNNSTHWR